jgi:hypothetical protein
MDQRPISWRVGRFLNRSARFATAPGRIIQETPFLHMRNSHITYFAIVFLSVVPSLLGESRTMHINHQYLNVPIGRQSEMRLFQILINGRQQREFAMQLAESSIDYWVFVDVSEFKGQTIIRDYSLRYRRADILLARYAFDTRLRSLDALQLGVALDLRDQGVTSTLVAADLTVTEIANREGLSVVVALG